MKKILVAILIIFVFVFLISCFWFFYHKNKTENKMTISSSAFSDKGQIPRKYTCDGEKISPPLKISNVPVGSKSLVLTMLDPRAPTGDFVHWIKYNIPAIDQELAEGDNSFGQDGLNSFKVANYFPPCPSFGTHLYIFDLYALDIDFNTETSLDKKGLDFIMGGHILATSRLMGFYSR